MFKKKPSKSRVKTPSDESENIFYPGIENAASAAECTGMMHAPPQNEDEQDAYAELFSMETPDNRNEN